MSEVNKEIIDYIETSDIDPRMKKFLNSIITFEYIHQESASKKTYSNHYKAVIKSIFK